MIDIHLFIVSYGTILISTYNLCYLSDDREAGVAYVRPPF